MQVESTEKNWFSSGGDYTGRLALGPWPLGMQTSGKEPRPLSRRPWLWLGGDKTGGDRPGGWEAPSRSSCRLEGCGVL